MNPLRQTSVLVIANEQVGEAMAGPAIRAVNLASQLAATGARVTLAAPQAPQHPLPELAAVTCVGFGKPSAAGFKKLADQHQLVVTQPQRVDVNAGLFRSRARIIYDLYVPAFIETIAHLADETGSDSYLAALLRLNQQEYASALAMGDAFICASQRQHDHWLGALGACGRLDLHLLQRDAQAQGLVGVVPFGLPDQPPPPLTQPPLRGSLVAADSVIALWTGGLWNWFDPVVIAQGLAAARVEEPRLQLVVMGMKHPDAAATEHRTAREFLQVAAELGLAGDGNGLSLLPGWVAYDQRHRFLQDADAGVSAHFETAETHFSFRTRFLDQLWCALPTMTNPGGELTDDILAAGAGLAVTPSTPQQWQQQFLRLARDQGLRTEMSRKAARLAQQYRWSVVVQPLLEIAMTQAQLHQSGAAKTGRLPLAQMLSYANGRIRVRVQSKGVSSLASALRQAVAAAPGLQQPPNPSI